MAGAATTVTVKILDKEDQVSCLPEEIEELHATARHLDGQMRTIREGGRVFGVDRIAVMAALNITHDMLRLKGVQSANADTDRRIKALAERVGNTLVNQRG
jgi:cell division protein ZapA